jgi:hypothetical protein
MELLGKSIRTGEFLNLTIANSEWYLLWKCCCKYAPFIFTNQQFSDGFYNKKSVTFSRTVTHTLAGILQTLIDSGQIEKYEEEVYYEELSCDGCECELCNGTGKDVNGARCENCLGKGICDKVFAHRGFNPVSAQSLMEFLYMIDSFSILSEAESINVTGLLFDRCIVPEERNYSNN